MYSSSWVTSSTTVHVTCSLSLFYCSWSSQPDQNRQVTSHHLPNLISFFLFWQKFFHVILTVRSASCRIRHWMRAVRPKWAVTLRETFGSKDGQTFGSSQKEMGREGGSIGLPAWIDDVPAPDVFIWRKEGKKKMVIHCFKSIVLSRESNGREKNEWIDGREKSIGELAMMGIVTRWKKREKSRMKVQIPKSQIDYSKSLLPSLLRLFFWLA